jgi:hypothetical protein
MRVWVVELYDDFCGCGYEISRVCSSFDKAKDSVRADVEEFVGQFDEEEATNMMNDFEKTGRIEEFVRMYEYEVD